MPLILMPLLFDATNEFCIIENIVESSCALRKINLKPSTFNPEKKHHSTTYRIWTQTHTGKMVERTLWALTLYLKFVLHILLYMFIFNAYLSLSNKRILYCIQYEYPIVYNTNILLYTIQYSFIVWYYWYIVLCCFISLSWRSNILCSLLYGFESLRMCTFWTSRIVIIIIVLLALTAQYSETHRNYYMD